MNQDMLNEMTDRLYRVIIKLESVEDCREFFDCLCTNREVEQMAQRVEAAALLKQGKTYAQVMEQTSISSATLSRVSRALQYGQGYKKFVDI